MLNISRSCLQSPRQISTIRRSVSTLVFADSNFDDLAKSHWNDGFVKSSRCKARKN
jgi:HSP90 family molecular chaperone